uniref:C-type lectin domain-containing protein n=1 Tax=Dicentrarchus labrax TaxID=13489 RepID=A0A8P4KKM1_DICLA
MNGSQYMWILNGLSLILTSGALAGHLLQNVALNQKATQSSQYGDKVAARAVDGNRDGKSDFCACTNIESDPWWRVDLQNTYKIYAVIITNRNWLESSLDGAEIWIGSSTETNDDKKIRCAIISHIPSRGTFYFPCRAAEGRYVTVLHRGSNKILSLCEVEVYTGYPLANVALKGDAAQSSTLSFATASKAIDGRRNSFYERGSCSHTAEDETNPWWRVDLGGTYIVMSVKVTNRGDCCAERLDGAEIRIGNSQENNGNNNPRQDCCSERLLGAQILIGNSPEINDKNLRCGTISSVQNMSTHTFQCGDIEGRYVTVVIPGEDKILTLCEVEVYASLAEPEAFPPPPPPPPPPPTESMQLSGRTVTVVGDRLCWSDALFYCRHHHWDLLSLRSEEEQSAVEQLLSRSPFPLTDFVWLGLRRYIMRNTWFWMSGDSMKFSKWSYSSAPFHCSYSYYPCGGMAKGERHLWEDQPCEELLNFICESRAEDGAQRVSFNSTRKVLSGD